MFFLVLDFYGHIFRSKQSPFFFQKLNKSAYLCIRKNDVGNAKTKTIHHRRLQRCGKNNRLLYHSAEILNCREFVNADEIVKGLSPFQPEKIANTTLIYDNTKRCRKGY